MMKRTYVLGKIDIKEAIAFWLNSNEGTNFKASDVTLHHQDAEQDGIYAGSETYSAEVSE